MSHGQLLHLNGLAMEKATPKFQNMSLCGTDPNGAKLVGIWDDFRRPLFGEGEARFLCGV